MVVLQVEDKPVTVDDKEGPQMAEGFRSGIEELVARGVADAARVGLIAFSRTGYHALFLLAQYPDLLLAANISDAVQAGYWGQLLAVNAPAVEAELARMAGGPPEGENLGAWFSRNPLYTLPKSSTALRIEAIGPESVLGMWETFAILRRAKRPVDVIYFPRGSHNLQKPRERLASMGGNVDWFRFWLQGYERKASMPGSAETEQSLHEQYQRWERLCDKQIAEKPSRRTFCVASKSALDFLETSQ
jgi:hypothetical protein